MNSIKLSPLGLDDKGRWHISVGDVVRLHEDASALALLHQPLAQSLLTDHRFQVTRGGAFLTVSAPAQSDDLRHQLESIATLTGAIHAHAVDPTPTTTKGLEDAEALFDPEELQSLQRALGRVVSATARELHTDVGGSSVAIHLPHRAQLRSSAQSEAKVVPRPQGAPVVRGIMPATEVLCDDGTAVLVAGGESIQRTQRLLINLQPPQAFGWNELPLTTDGEDHEGRR